MGNKILTIVIGTTILLTSIVLALGLTTPAFARVSEPASVRYQKGYDDGCAGNVVPGPHTSHNYNRGYADGQAACAQNGRPSPEPQPLPNNPRSSSSDWTLTVNINNVNFGESSIGVNLSFPKI
jgi:hypothetical protein